MFRFSCLLLLAMVVALAQASTRGEGSGPSPVPVNLVVNLPNTMGAARSDDTGTVVTYMGKLVDRSSGITQSLDPQAAYFPVPVSGDGRYVLVPSLQALSGDPADLYTSTWFRLDRSDSTYTRIGRTLDSSSVGSTVDISDDGRYTALVTEEAMDPGDTNVCGPYTYGCPDVYLVDALTSTSTRISLGPNGEQTDAPTSFVSISGDGNVIAWVSTATTIVPGDTNAVADIFIHDVTAGTTTRITNPLGQQLTRYSGAPDLSFDGRYLAFESDDASFTPGDGIDRDVFVLDRQTGVTEMVSLTDLDAQANDYSQLPTISDDGRFVAFVSKATDFVAGDIEGKRDVFVRERQLGETLRVSQRMDGAGGDGDAMTYAGTVHIAPQISGNGRVVFFAEAATNLSASGSGLFAWGCTPPDGDGDCLPDGFEASHACLNMASDDASADPDADGVTNLDEQRGPDGWDASGDESDPCSPDTDGDGFKDPSPGHVRMHQDVDWDNCPSVSNPSQFNNDGNFIELGPSRAYDDLTHPNSDRRGDACDDDDDNDGLTDAAEASGCGMYTPDANGGVVFAYVPSDPLLMDTDRDGFPDGWECAHYTSPADASLWFAFPLVGSGNRDADLLPASADPDDLDPDFDGDGLLDGVEVYALRTSPLRIDSDGDGCADGTEQATVNGDLAVNAIDLSQVAGSFGVAPNAKYAPTFDANRDRNINSLDLMFVATRFGRSCPPS